MFTFAVKDDTDRTGSVVSSVLWDPTRPCAYVVVMWDDDFSFTTCDVEELSATPLNSEGKFKPEIVPGNFGGEGPKGDETIN